MGENKDSRKSEGFCQKMRNAVCPLGSRIRHVSTSNDKKQAEQIMHQTSLNKMIPVEFNHNSAEKTKKSAPKSNHARFAKAKTKKDDEPVHDDRFSEYIKKVKNRMMKTASSIGGGGRISVPRRDSFNDKVTNYIDQAKMKIRTTTNVGVEKSISPK